MSSRRIATTAVAALMATGVVAGATTNPAVAAEPGPRPVTSWIDAVPAGETTWVSVYWTTGRKICDGSVSFDGYGVQVGYPENTGAYASFSQSAELKPGRLDYTAFTVRPRAGKNLFRQVEATLIYNTCGQQAVEKSERFRLTFAVLPVSARK